MRVKTIRGITHFRRAGFAFGRDPIEIDPAKLKPAQLAAIRAEPKLEVVGDAPVEDDKTPSEKPDKGSDKKPGKKA